jgi:uncharacterized protein (TIGR03435 family)
LWTIPAGFAQTTAALPAFEVASIRPNTALKGGEGMMKHGGIDRITIDPERLTMYNVTLRGCIRVAFEMKDYQVVGPSWMNDERFDITAKAAQPVPEKDLHLMLQRLLAERFKLEYHKDKKDLPAYVLVIGKGGPKFRESKSDGEFSARPISRTQATIERATVAQLVDVLTQVLRVPIIDQTGLTGHYDVTVDMTSYLPEGFDHSNGPPPDLQAIVMAAVQEQLGLKLESRKVLLDEVIVDHIERAPVEN